MKNTQLNLFGEKIIQQSSFPKSHVSKIDTWYNVNMFLFYPKNEKNPNGDPVPKQSVRSKVMPRKSSRPLISNNKRYYTLQDLYVSHYQLKEITDTEEALGVQALSVMQANKVPIFENEVIIEEITYYFNPLKSFSKKVKENIVNHIEVPKVTTPDLSDNLNKLLLDSLRNIVYKDDNIIWQLKNAKKIYGVLPGVQIKLLGR